MSSENKEYFITAIIAAAGVGERMNAGINKQFLSIHHKMVIVRTLEKFFQTPTIDEIILVVREDEMTEIKEILATLTPSVPIQLVVGGRERQDSISNALQRVHEDCTIILTHDGARPFITTHEIERIIEGAINFGACCLMTPLKDTVKISDDGSWANFTPDRSTLYAIQTPQGFQREVLEHAYNQAYNESYYGTDDCSLVEKTGHPVKLIRGSYNNIKITTPEDLILGEAIVKKMEEADLCESDLG